MMVEMVSYYMTDFGPVELPKYAASLPKRKNGQFDMRFVACRELVANMKTAAAMEFQRYEPISTPFYDLIQRRVANQPLTS